jgi:2-amino-4-hydroxy-6-hydroxymethyldihydropteridine diphosphokinase
MASSAALAAAQTAFIGLGANLGNARRTLADAVRGVRQIADTSVVSVSSLYRSAPVDSSGPDYLNAVARIETTLAPIELLRALQVIELAHGRERPYFNAPRTLDLDILSYDGLVQSDPDLTLPHPRAHQRAFVLRPWAELEFDWLLPGYGPVGKLSAALTDQQIEVLVPAGAWLM